MTIVGLLKKHGVAAPRYASPAGAVFLAEAGADSQNAMPGYQIPPHTFHGGVESRPGPALRENVWWFTEGALDRDRALVARHFPSFVEAVQVRPEDRPAWSGSIDTGYGQFAIEVSHREDRGLPRVRVLDAKRRGRVVKGLWFPAPHTFTNGNLCVAAEEDWNAEESTIADVIAWSVHWHACYVSWRVSGIWPSPGIASAA